MSLGNMIEAFFEFMSYIDQISTPIMHDLSIATNFEPWHLFVNAKLTLAKYMSYLLAKTIEFR